MTMSVFVAPAPKSPATLTYLELRKAVGFIAIGLPFGVALPRLILRHSLEGSISAYYYTSSRDLFVGSLCAIAMFLLCCRGFDTKDLIAGGLAALFALGVAFFPMKPEDATPTEKVIGHVHVIAATLLFSTLAVFCLWLFKMTAHGVRLTQKKIERNRVYTLCGWVIVGSMVAIGVCRMFNITSIVGIGPWLIFETTALWAFGFAWLTKGEFILKDESES
jgi:hypothetical protein